MGVFVTGRMVVMSGEDARDNSGDGERWRWRMKIRVLMVVEVMEISETSWCDGSEGSKYDNDYEGSGDGKGKTWWE